MIITKFNTATIPNGMRKMKPLVTFSRANGIVSFNKEAVEALNLKPGSRVEFFQAERQGEKDWYMICKNSKDGWELRTYHTKSLYLGLKVIYEK